jgi:putative endonuclease
MALHNQLGIEGEQLALEYLEKNGFAVLEKNWRHGKAEIDLIAMQGKILVVMEVKTRSTGYFGAPEEAVTITKQRLLAEAANEYLIINGLEHEVRFDIISIITDGTVTSLDHITDAFYPFSG